MDKWNEILTWESENGFVGDRSMVWSQLGREVYFYYLIENHFDKFIKAIPLSTDFHQSMKTTADGKNLLHFAAQYANKFDMDALRPFVEHLFKYDFTAFYLKDQNNQTPLMIAICSNNLVFMQTVFGLLQNRDADLDGFNAQDMQRVFEPLSELVKSRSAPSHEMLQLLYRAGTTCYFTSNANSEDIDFQKYFPDLPKTNAPFSSPELFLKAINHDPNTASSSNSIVGFLPGSYHYWNLLLQGAILTHNRTRLAAWRMQSLLDSLNPSSKLEDVDKSYYDRIDKVLFLLRAEQLFSEHQSSQAKWTGLNPLRRVSDHMNSRLDGNAGGIVFTSVLFLIALGLYSYLMFYFVDIENDAHHDWKHAQKNLRDSYPECGNNNITCVNPIYTWDCCPDNNLSDWCTAWFEDYKHCENKYEKFNRSTNSAILFGTLGFIAMPFAALFIMMGILGIWTNLPSLRPYHFTPNNVAPTHQVLKELLELIRKKCPILLDNDPSLNDLGLLDFDANRLNHERFVNVTIAMEKLLIKYINNVAFLPNMLRISLQELEDIIKKFPNSRLVTADATEPQPARSAEATTRPLLLSVQDIETGHVETSNNARRRSCVIL